MKKSNTYSPYGTYNQSKIDAPKNTKKDEPKSSRIIGTSDLRAGGKK